jgi:capsular polysaccharide biosynthesis protein
MSLSSALEIMRRRWVAIAGTIVLGLVALMFLRNFIPSTYGATARVLTVNDTTSQEPPAIDLPGLATSSVVLGRVIDKLQLPMSLTELRDRVSARVLQRSNLMEIGFRDASADRAVAVPNAVADELSKYYNQISTKRYDQSVAGLDASIAAEHSHLNDLAQRIQAASTGDAFIGSDTALDTITEQLNDLETQRGVAYSSLVGDKAAEQASDGQAPAVSRLVASQILQSDPLYRKAHDAAARDAAQLAYDQSQYTSRYPGLAGEVAKVAAENAQLRVIAEHAMRAPDAYSQAQADGVVGHERAVALVAGDEAKVSALDSLIAEERSRLGDYASSGAAVATLKAERDASVAELLALSQRRAQTIADRAEAYSLGYVVVVDRAVRADTELASGRTRISIVLAMLILALSFGVAWMLENMDPRLRHAGQVEDLYGQPIIASLGSVTDGSKVS